MDVIDPGKLIRPYRVTDGRRFRLGRMDPSETGPFDAAFKVDARKHLLAGVERLRKLQEKLYAQDSWGVLIILQAMDAAGKDGLIEHVMSGVNPQGVQVFSFKAPSAEELDHDFMWRTTRALPERGRIGIFNRSYYEEVLIVRVHPEIFAAQKLPVAVREDSRVWEHRYEDILAFERYLSRNGFLILKFFLHVSKSEQRRRFLKRVDDPDKNWKFSAADVRERRHWKAYMSAYENAIRWTSAPHAPWFVVPADNKWFTRLVVVAAIVKALDDLQLRFPRLDPRKGADLIAARKALLNE
jgi:PPK2 family polyphosphate:nucleotide phosphotransferase